ncbi:uncharacterized protein LOC116405025 [Cucumis sativus]|uniref:uncharacterized protein LOC116405025 n=1 Tax=Cucumis sativus TaxID=3659 RepID=UPI0012F496BC|nr:uncharacterized protein LOC116405025 [Cucumis sativus]KAE8645688.1 hypothetical protein Csa_020261 [Cucumis sativus]
MDSFAANSKKSFHIRSNSLPSKPHPVVDEVNENLCRLRASEEATSSSSSLCQKLDGLQDLQDSIDKLLLLPHTHQALVDNKSVDDLLEGSLKILDVCALAKDVLSQMKESAHELESALRRRKDDKIDVQKYLNSRKMVKKAIHMTLKGMKKTNFQKSDESSEIVSLLKEAETVTYNSIESLLLFVAGPKFPSKMSRWSLVSKFIQPKKVVSKDEDTNENEVEMVDVALCSITNHKSDFLVQVEDVQKSLRKLESCICDFEEDLESLYRRLVKNRVSFLNILNY